MADDLSIQQRRFKHALGKVRAVVGEEENIRDGYLRWARSLAADMRAIGLGQALATLRADIGSRGAGKLFADIEHWLVSENKASPYYGEREGLLAAVTGKPEPDYLAAHAELDAYMGFHKRLAEAFLKQQKPTKSAGEE